MTILLTIVHVIVCFFLVVVVLLQSGKAADLAGAFGGMGSQTAFGPRGSATVLSKATTIAATLFMLTSLSPSDPRNSRGFQFRERAGTEEGARANQGFAGGSRAGAEANHPSDAAGRQACCANTGPGGSTAGAAAIGAEEVVVS